MDSFEKKTQHGLARIFIYSSATLLLVTAAGKLVSATGSARVLEASDPIFGIHFRYFFWIAGIVELTVALFCFSRNRIELKTGIIAWLATTFLFYRFSLVFIGYHGLCHCLGTLTDALPISAETADTAMKIILAYLLLGSYASLFWLWRQRKKTISASLSVE